MGAIYKGGIIQLVFDRFSKILYLVEVHCALHDSA